MAYSNQNYKPQKKSKAILDRAMIHISSVDYAVSLRWVFYRLLQDGLYENKKDYKRWETLSSRARHSFYEEWNPLTLSDETRDMINVSIGGNIPSPDIDGLIAHGLDAALDEREALQYEINNYEYDLSYDVDSNYFQDYLVFIMFEARAMTAQFKKYAGQFDLIPCAGQPSIPFKYEVAQYISDMAERYDLPAVVLFFSDYDKAGLTIFKTVKEDVSKWAKCNIEFIRGGLTLNQARIYAMPENPDHPKSYQWEALTDEQAKTIIDDSLKPYYNSGAIEEAREAERRINSTVNEAVNMSLDIG